jgi:hypothetical protein
LSNFATSGHSLNTLQGVRTVDSNSGTWTTPDDYAGNVNDPISQKSYALDDDNAITNSDASGYAVGGMGRVSSGPDAGMWLGDPLTGMPDTGLPDLDQLLSLNPGPVKSLAQYAPPDTSCPSGSIMCSGMRVIANTQSTWQGTLAGVVAGSTLYRVFGGQADLFGRYWSLNNPMLNSDYASHAGIPKENTMERMAIGRLLDPSQTITSTATAVEEGQAGGMTEVQVPNASASIEVQSVVPYDPIPFDVEIL